MSTLALVGAPIDVKAALRRFKRDGHALDADDVNHQTAYMACRSGGIARVTAHKVLAYIANAKDLSSHGSSITLQCHGVPVENFSSGLPEALKEFLKTAEDLADFVLSDDLDMGGFYLLDGCVPRDRLGKNVRDLKFFSSVKTQVNLGRPQAALALGALLPATGGRPASTDNIPAITDAHPASRSSQAAGQPQAAGVTTRTLKRLASSGADETEDPSVKRRRLLMDLLTKLKMKILAAADKGNWHTTSD